MSRAILLAVAAAAVAALPATAFAKMDCHAVYEATKTHINGKQIGADHREAAFRLASHAYDLCTIGDEVASQSLFDKLNQN